MGGSIPEVIGPAALAFSGERFHDSGDLIAATKRIEHLLDRVLKNQGKQMTDFSALQVAIAQLGTDATADHDAIIAAFTVAEASIADLTAQVAALVAGEVTQATIDALTESVAAADAAVNDAAAAVVPVVTPTA